MELMQASRQWATRPDDERFTSIPDMIDHFRDIRARSREVVVSNRRILAVPTSDRDIVVRGPNGADYSPTNWAFSQIARMANAPPAYLRKLPAPIAADCMNYGLQFSSEIEDVGILLMKAQEPVLRAATGPRYGRIWNSDVLEQLSARIGDGVTGYWKVPGEFGKPVAVTKENTTLYGSDRDVFVFLADEERRLVIPNRRNGQSGSMARGIFLWNSEVGDASLGIATFLFDYACSNRIVWGATRHKQISIRHSAGAPDRWVEQVLPAIDAYANEDTHTIVSAIAAAKEKRLGDNVGEFLRNRFSAPMTEKLMARHMLEEGRPIESLWDVTTAITAAARDIPHQDQRVALERKGGDILDLASR